jgi:hypothetical protein
VREAPFNGASSAFSKSDRDCRRVRDKKKPTSVEIGFFRKEEKAILPLT